MEIQKRLNNLRGRTRRAFSPNPRYNDQTQLGKFIPLSIFSMSPDDSCTTNSKTHTRTISAKRSYNCRKIYDNCILCYS